MKRISIENNRNLFYLDNGIVDKNGFPIQTKITKLYMWEDFEDALLDRVVLNSIELGYDYDSLNEAVDYAKYKSIQSGASKHYNLYIPLSLKDRVEGELRIITAVDDVSVYVHNYNDEDVYIVSVFDYSKVVEFDKFPLLCIGKDKLGFGFIDSIHVDKTELENSFNFKLKNIKGL